MDALYSAERRQELEASKGTQKARVGLLGGFGLRPSLRTSRVGAMRKAWPVPRARGVGTHFTGHAGVELGSSTPPNSDPRELLKDLSSHAAAQSLAWSTSHRPVSIQRAAVGTLPDNRGRKHGMLQLASDDGELLPLRGGVVPALDRSELGANVDVPRAGLYDEPP